MSTFWEKKIKTCLNMVPREANICSVKNSKILHYPKFTIFIFKIFIRNFPMILIGQLTRAKNYLNKEIMKTFIRYFYLLFCEFSI